MWQSGESGDGGSIVERVDHVQFGETIQNGTFGLDDGGISRAAGRVQLFEKCANRIEQWLMFCDH